MQRVSHARLDHSPAAGRQHALRSVQRNHDRIRVVDEVQREAAPDAGGGGTVKEMQCARIVGLDASVPYERQRQLPAYLDPRIDLDVALLVILAHPIGGRGRPDENALIVRADALCAIYHRVETECLYDRVHGVGHWQTMRGAFDQRLEPTWREDGLGNDRIRLNIDQHWWPR